MKHTKELNGRNIDIYSCYEYDKSLVRDICHEIKENQTFAHMYAAKKMSDVIRENFGRKRFILVPIPSCNGKATTNLELCEYIKQFIQCDVRDILRGKRRKSVYETKKINPNSQFSREFFGFRIRKTERLHVILVDNVFDTGVTCTFASELFDRVSVLTFAHTK